MVGPSRYLPRLMDEIAKAARTVPGLTRVFPYPPDKLEPPALLVAWPDIDYDHTYGRGSDDLVFPVVLVLGRGGVDRERWTTIAGWLGTDIKDAIEGYSYTGDPVVHVRSAEVTVAEIAGMDYLSVVFTTAVTVTKDIND